MAKSIKSLNPLKAYIRALTDNLDKTNIPKKMNLVLDGGAFNGGYMGGVLFYIKELERLKITSVDKISGCSIGAISALLYFSDNIDYSISIFEQVLTSLRATLCLSKIIPLVKSVVDLVDIDKINNKLFITYYDIETMQQVLVSTYNSKEELLEVVIRSSFIPYLIDGNLSYKDRYCDGCSPYIFKKEDIPTLFISLQKFSKLHNIIYIKNEVNIWSRLLDGIADMNGFFANKHSEFCSYVNKWSILDFHIFHLKEFFFFMLVVIFHYYTYLNKNVPNNIKSNKYLVRIVDIISALYKTIFSYIII